MAIEFEHRGVSCTIVFHNDQRFQGRSLSEPALRPLMAVFDIDQDRCAARLRQRIDDYLDYWRQRSVGSSMLKARRR